MGESCAHYKADGLDAENPGKRLDRYTQCPEPGQSTAIICGVVGQTQSDTYTHKSVVGRVRPWLLPSSFGMKCLVKFRTRPLTLSKEVLLGNHFFCSLLLFKYQSEVQIRMYSEYHIKRYKHNKKISEIIIINTHPRKRKITCRL